jgi:exopolyphosphatase/pppGpp-phosphohydrolase
VVTAPGRQSTNATELLDRLAAASWVIARVLSAGEEGRLAYLGAFAAAQSLPDLVAVVDVGGGQARPEDVWAARREVRRLLSKLEEEPAPGGALATGGGARGLRRVVGHSMPTVSNGRSRS